MLEQFLRNIQEDPEFENQIVVHRRLSSREKVSHGSPQEFSPPVQNALGRLGISSLYSHQFKAISRIKKGENAAVLTPTASGKTIVYTVSVFEAILKDPQSRALYLFPIKALAQDQLKVIREFEKSFDLVQPAAAIDDGDTSSYRRKKIRQSPPNILLTNPDMLHLSILPRHPQWETFFQNLRFILIDEVHTYRGVFGSHVAQVLRRLRRVCAFYGADPIYILTSATVGNPQEFLQQLIDLPFKIITENGAPQAARISCSSILAPVPTP